MVVWQKSQDLAAKIAEIVARLPRNLAADVIGNQVLRSAGSVPAKIAGGDGRYSAAAYLEHLSIARGSLFETQSWLDLLHRTDFIDDDARTSLVQECQSVDELLTLSMKSLADADPAYAREEGEG